MTGTYKVSATQLDGYRCAGMMVIVGIDAAAKARRTGEAIVDRTREILAAAGLGDYTCAQIELLGNESLYGPHSRTQATREAMVRVVVDHPNKKALEIFAREIAPSGTSWSPGTTMPAGGRPSPSPLIKPFSFLLDKGNLSNIGLIARRPELLLLLWQRVTPEVVQRYFAHLVKGRVERCHLPGIHAMNLVLHDALAGGGPASRVRQFSSGMPGRLQSNQGLGNGNRNFL